MLSRWVFIAAALALAVAALLAWRVHRSCAPGSDAMRCGGSGREACLCDMPSGDLCWWGSWKPAPCSSTRPRCEVEAGQALCVDEVQGPCDPSPTADHCIGDTILEECRPLAQTGGGKEKGVLSHHRCPEGTRCAVLKEPLPDALLGCVDEEQRP